MIASWMVYCSLVALALSVAAALAERVLLAGRAPVRFVWIGSLLLSLVVPAAAFRLAELPPASHTSSAADLSLAPSSGVQSAFTTAVSIDTPVASPQSGIDWSALLARLDTPLTILWVTLSLTLIFDFLGGVLMLARMRRGWQRRELQGVPVFVSKRTGPAVVGAVSPVIVLPEWALGLEASQLALTLRHEREHQRTGDNRLLTAAQLALIVMPWNPALWWQIVRLRVAVELDCDARVLQNADARSYGDLLLETARAPKGSRLMGATAFAERATHLERRIRVLPRHRLRTTRSSRVLATCIVVSAVSGAWIAPRPPAPPHTAAPLEPPVVKPAEKIAAAPELSAPGTAIERHPSNTPVPDKAPIKTVASGDLGGASRNVRIAPALFATANPCDQGAPQEITQAVETIFSRLFDGIVLTTEQAAKACALLTRLQQEQLVIDSGGAVVALRTQTIRFQRDSSLRDLLTNEADRATFDARVAQSFAGGRGRSGGTPLGAAGRGRGGGVGGTAADTIGSARMGGGGRVGRGGGAALPDTSASRFNDAIMELTYQRLFDGIQLTADQETRARELLRISQGKISSERTVFSVRLRMNAMGMVTMPAESEAALGALVPNDIDRAKLQSRIASIGQ